MVRCQKIVMVFFVCVQTRQVNKVGFVLFSLVWKNFLAI
jgi:hypothetical protein